MMNQKVIKQLEKIANECEEPLPVVMDTYNNKVSQYVKRDLIQQKPVKGIFEAEVQSYHCLAVMSRYSRIYKR